MAFDAGEIKGSLNLDTTSFNKGFNEAHTHAETEGGRIREILESVAEVVYETLGPAMAQFSQQLQSVFAGFSEGPIIGSLGAIATAFGAVREAVGDVAADFHTLGIEAEKAGVSVEFMDRFSNVAATAGLGIEQVGTAFKVLEQRGEEALGAGGEKVAAAFEKIGISVADLPALLEKPQELMERVQEGMNRLPTAAERNAEALRLVGRQGAGLIPIFMLTKEQFDDLAEKFDRLAGSATMLLEEYFKKGFEGIQRAVSEPVLEHLAAHMTQTEPMLEGIVNRIVGGIQAGFGFIGKGFELAQPSIDGLTASFSSAWTATAPLQAALGELAKALWDLLSPIVGGLLEGFVHLAEAAIPELAKAITATLTPIIHLVAVIVEDLVPAAKLLGETFSLLGSIIGEVFVLSLQGAERAIKAIYDALEFVVDLVKGVVIKAFEELSNSPLKPAMDALVNVFREIGREIGIAGDKASEFLDVLEKLAGIGGSGIGPNIPGAKNADEARREMGLAPKEETHAEHSVPSTAGDGPAHAAPVTHGKHAKKTHSVASPAVGGDMPALDDAHTAHTAHATGSTHAADQTGHNVQQRSLETSTGGSHVQAMQKLVEALQAIHKQSEAAHATPYGTVRGELTDAVADSKGLYNVRSASAKGMGGALDDAGYRNLRQSERESRPGQDSISQWRKSHGQQTDSVAQRASGGGSDVLKSSFERLSGSVDALTSHLRAGGGSGGGGPVASAKPTAVTNNYAIHLGVAADQTKTASALAGVLMPALRKLQDKQQKDLQGQMVSAAVAASLGGN